MAVFGTSNLRVNPTFRRPSDPRGTKMNEVEATATLLAQQKGTPLAPLSPAPPCSVLHLQPDEDRLALANRERTTAFTGRLDPMG
jgi:hypothetical protein